VLVPTYFIFIRWSIHTPLFARSLFPNLMNVPNYGKICLLWQCQTARTISSKTPFISTFHLLLDLERQFTAFRLIGK